MLKIIRSVFQRCLLRAMYTGVSFCKPVGEAAQLTAFGKRSGRHVPNIS